MSSRLPSTVNLSLEEFARHGGLTNIHKDGWGIAYFEDNDVRLIREAEPASNSPWVELVERLGLSSNLVLSHIRRATQGEPSLKNTQPFARELGGRMHVFAHNGHLEGIADAPGFTLGAYQPIGDTDSEHAFCVLLNRLQGVWGSSDKIPALEARLAKVSEFAHEMGTLGPANFLYADSDTLFAHGHRRTQKDGRVAPPGLHFLCRRCAGENRALDASGIWITSPDQEVGLLASVPLTSEAWSPLGEGEIMAISDGRVVARVGP